MVQTAQSIVLLHTSTKNKMLKLRKNPKTFSIFRMMILRVNVIDVPLLAVGIRALPRVRLEGNANE